MAMCLRKCGYAAESPEASKFQLCDDCVHDVFNELIRPHLGNMDGMSDGYRKAEMLYGWVPEVL